MTTWRKIILFCFTGVINILLMSSHYYEEFSNRFEMNTSSTQKKINPITIFFCGDVMTGRGIDQILPHPSDPILYEPYVKNAINKNPIRDMFSQMI